MKNFLIYIIVSTTMSITGGLIYAKYYLSPKVKDLLQAKASEVLGVPVQIHDLRVLVLPRLSLAATGIKFTMTNPSLKVDIPRLFINVPINKSLFSSTSTFGPVKIRIEEPRVSLDIAPQKSVETVHSQDQIVTHTRIKYNRDISAELNIVDAKFKMTQFSPTGETENETILDPLQLDLTIPGIEKKWVTTLTTHLSMSRPQLGLPVGLSTEFSLKDEVLTIDHARGNVAGVLYNLSGEQNFADNIANWKILISTNDFSKTNLQIAFLKKVSGELQSEVDASLAPGQAWKFNGTLKAKSLIADIDWTKDDLKVSGPIRVDCDSRFSFSFSNNLKIEQFKLHSQFDSISIYKPGVFSKPAGVPLDLDVNLGAREQLLFIRDLKFRFANMNASATGEFSIAEKLPGEIQFRIDPFELNGWEKYLPAASSAPMSGRIESSPTLKLSANNDMSVEFNSTQLSKVKLTANYHSPMLELNGPVEIDSDIKGTFDPNAGLLHSPMTMNGSSNIHFSRFVVKTNSQNMSASTPSQISPIQIVYDWQIFKTSNFKLNAVMDQFMFDSSSLEHVDSAFTIEKQALNGSVKIAKYLNGEVEFKKLNVDFKKTNPELLGELYFKKIDLNLLSGVSTQQKAEANGQSFFALPLSPNWKSRVRAKGNLDARNFLPAEKNLDDLINEQAARLPGAKSVAVKQTPSASALKLQFELVNTDFRVSDVKVITPLRNEIQAQGSVTLPNLELNLGGYAYLSDPPFGGDVRTANSDAQGRFVLPFRLAGTAKNPQFKIDAASIQEMIRKTFTFAAKRELDKFKAPSVEKATVTPTPDPSDQEEVVDEPEQPKKPSKNKVDEFKSRLQGIFDSH